MESDLVIKGGVHAGVVEQSGDEIVHVISSGTLDRDNEVVHPAGMRRGNHAGMTVFYNHDTTQPIGVCRWVKPHGDKVLAKTRLTDKTEFARDIKALVQDGVLRSFSIGFRTMGNDGPPTQTELKSRPQWAGARRVFRDWDLHEYSLVGVPANPDAIVQAEGKGLISPATALILKGSAPAADGDDPAKGGTIELNRDAVAWARAQIAAGKIDRDTPWSWAPADAHRWLSMCDGDWKKYGKMFLGKRVGANPETQSAWAFPVGHAGKVYLSGLRAALTRAAQYQYTEIEDAARKLYDEAAKKAADPAELKALIARLAAERLRRI